jgi:hypothetical protein
MSPPFSYISCLRAQCLLLLYLFKVSLSKYRLFIEQDYCILAPESRTVRGDHTKTPTNCGRVDSKLICSYYFRLYVTRAIPAGTNLSFTKPTHTSDRITTEFLLNWTLGLVGP